MKKLWDRGDTDSKVFNIDRAPNNNGTVPYQRLLMSFTFLILVAGATAYATWERVFYPIPPNDALDTSSLLGWVGMSLVLPHLITYTLTTMICIYILSQGTWSWIWWYLKESGGRIIITYAVMEFLIVIILTAGILGLPTDYFVNTVASSDRTQVSIIMENSAIVVLLIPPLVGYITAWRTYRLVGAQTMQDRYEKDLKRIEIKNSGQMWDRLTKLTLPKILGINGETPPGLLIWAAISVMSLIAFMSTGLAFMVQIIYSFGLFCAAPLTYAIAAAIAKRRDGKPSIKRPTYLSLVRGPGTVDTYDPSRTGIRQFDRS